MAKSGGIKAGRAFVEIGVQMEAFEKGLRRAQARLKAFGAGALQMGGVLSGAAASIIAPLTLAVKTFINLGDSLEEMSQRTGFTVETLSELEYGATRTGASLETLEGGIRKMHRTINDAAGGMASAEDALAALGLTADALRQLSPEDQFKLIADRLSKVEDPGQRAALAMEILGRQGTMLLPLMQDGAAGIDAWIKKAREMGLTITGDTAKAAGELDDALKDVKDTVRAVAINVGAALAPEIKAAAQATREWLSGAVAWVKENKEIIVTAAKAAAVLGGVGAALIAVGAVATSAASILGVTATAVRGLSAAFTFLAANPVVLAIAAVTAGVTALGIAVERASRHTADLSDRMATLRQRADDLRSTDLERMRRLQQLGAQESRTSEEMAEAHRLAEQLQGRYGNLGIVVDDTTGRIINLAGALEGLTAAMQAHAADQINAEIVELRGNVSELEKEFADINDGTFFGNPLRNLKIAVFGDDAVRDEADAVRRQIEQALEEIRQRQARLDAMRNGDRSALTGEEPATGSPGSSDDIDAAEERRVQDWARRVAQLRLQAIEDEVEREKALINERYDHEIEQAERNDALIRQINEARALEMAELERRVAERKAEEERRRQESIDQANQDRAQIIEELTIRTSGADPLEIERQLLELQRRRAIEAATAAGENLDLVEQEFALRMKQLDMEQGAGEAKARVSAQGTFSAAVARLMGRGAGDFDRRAGVAAARSAALLQDIYRQLTRGPGLQWQS
jgi:hypothetical protein